MIGLDSIGVQSIGSDGPTIIAVPNIAVTLSVNSPLMKVTIDAPAVSVSVAINVPIISVFVDTPYGQAIGEEAIAVEAIAGGGKTGAATIVLLGEVPIVVTPRAPTVYSGKSEFVPAISVAVTPNVPLVVQSATVTIPNVLSIAVAANAPHLEHVINVGGINIVTSINAPFITAGKQVQVPNVAVTDALNVPSVYSGKRIDVPNVPISVQPNIPLVSAGVLINAWNTIDILVDKGSIASTSIGSYAIGEPANEALTFTHSIQISVVLGTPFITAGKSEFVPNIPIAVTTNRVEISARTRRVRVQFIAY